MQTKKPKGKEVKEMKDTYIEGVVSQFSQITPSTGLMKSRPILAGTVSVAHLRQALTEAYNKGREDEKQEWKAEAEHEQEKLLEGFSHKDCDRCRA